MAQDHYRSKIGAGSPLSHLSEYEIRQLPSHLIETGEYRTLHRLLALEDSQGENAWFQAKASLGETGGYFADLESAWNTAEKQDRDDIEAGARAANLAIEIRYAFTAASLASLAEIPGPMLLAFLRQKLWTAQQAVAYAWQMTSWENQLSAVTALAGVLDGELRHSCELRVFQLIEKGRAEFPSRTSSGGSDGLSIADEMLCALCLDALSASLPQSQIDAAIHAGNQINYRIWYIHAMHNLARRLPPEEKSALANKLWTMAGEARMRCLGAESLARIAPLFDAPEERETRIGEALHEAVDVIADLEAWKMMDQEPRTGTMTIAQPIQKAVREHTRPLRVIAPNAGTAQLQAALQFAESLSQMAAAKAMFVILPELAKRGLAADALSKAQSIENFHFRILTSAAIAPHLPASRRDGILRYAFGELAHLPELDVAFYCLSVVATYSGPRRRAGLIDRLIQASQGFKEVEYQSLRSEALLRATRSLEGCPLRQRPSLAERLLHASRETPTHGPQDDLLAFVVPWLSPARIHSEFVGCQKIDFGRELDRIRKDWEAPAQPSAPAAAAPRPPLPDDWVREAFEGLEALTENQRTRALLIAAPRLSSAMFAPARKAAHTLEGRYLQSKVLYALATHAPQELRAQAALEAVESFWERSSGLDDAGAMLQEMVDLAAAELRPALFQAWTVFLRSLARTSWNVMLNYLRFNACAVRALGGDDSIEECLRSCEQVTRWWGKSGGESTKNDKTQVEKEEDAESSSDLVSASSIGSPAALIDILIEAQQFDRARRLLDAVRQASAPRYSTLVDRITNSLIFGLAAAGKFDTIPDLLATLSQYSLETMEMLVRQFIAYGRSNEAEGIFVSVQSSIGSDAALPLASLIVEADLAEGHLPGALQFFARLTPVREPGRALDAYVDIAFMVTNALLRQGETREAETTVNAMRDGVADAVQSAGLRLHQLAAGVRDPARAEFWNRTIQAFTAMDRPQKQ